MMIKSFIFDFDGIITDTEPVHMESWLSILEPLGISFDEDEYRERYLGLNDRDFIDAVARVHEHHFSDIEKANMIEEKARSSIDQLQNGIPLLPGVREFIEEASKSYLLAICSGAMRGEIEFILRKLGWIERFKPIIASDSVVKGKPDPEGYIRTFEGLVDRSNSALLPENIIAVEDSPKGIKAAKMAGLNCLAVGNSYMVSELTGADWVVASLDEFDLNNLSGQ